MSDWKVITPETTTNLIVNPSFEDNITDFWNDDGNGTHTHTTLDSWIGAACLRITADAALSASHYSNSIALANGEKIYVQARGKLGSGASGDMLIYDVTNATTRATTSVTSSSWQHLQATWTNSTGGAVNVRVYLRNTTANGTSNIIFDAVQAEIDTSDYTTYCDGDQPGCEWNGEAHNSTSTRSGVSRAGGVVEDLEDDYSLYIEAVLGAGMAPRLTSRDGFGQLPGGALNNSVRSSRTLTLVGLIEATSLSDFHDKRKALVNLFNPEAYPRTEDGWQPVTIRYTGGTTDKEIQVHYEAGLEGDQNWQMPFNERVAIRFFAPDPNWYALGETSTALDTNDTATLRYVAGRLKSTGQWDDLGLTANPTANGDVYSICVAKDKSVYFGGNFTGMNNVAGRDYIARYIPSTDTWETVVGASDLNATVYIIAEGPDGKIYVGGDFTNADGIADADFFAVHDPIADTWAAVGTPNSGAANIVRVNDIAFDSNGNMYVVGVFLNWADVGAADGIAKWDGTSWSAVGATNFEFAYPDQVIAIAIDSDDNIFIGGSFDDCGGDANADNWAWYDGASWAAVDDIALNGAVQSMVFDEAGNLYVAGNFTNADSVANADYIFKWTGSAIEPLDIGTNAEIYHVFFAPDGKLFATGNFTIAGSLSTLDRIAIWNNSVWMAPDLNLSGAPAVLSIGFSNATPSITENYSIYIGCTTTGAAYFSGSTTVTNGGSIPAYPKIIISRSGGTTARLVSIRNETTGKTLYCDYSFVDGETLTIDTSPEIQSVNSSFFGSRYDAVLPGSDWSEFQLLPGANQITCFIDVTGAPTITANLLIKAPFDGVDD